MTFREPLPENCPPVEAENVLATRIVFRLVRTCPPTLDDFRSQREEKPNAVFHVTECQARGLSVHADRSDSEKATKLTALRGRLVCQVRLEVGAGAIQQTGRRSHYTWWPSADFDILAHCDKEVV